MSYCDDNVLENYFVFVRTEFTTQITTYNKRLNKILRGLMFDYRCICTLNCEIFYTLLFATQSSSFVKCSNYMSFFEDIEFLLYL